MTPVRNLVKIALSNTPHRGSGLPISLNEANASATPQSETKPMPILESRRRSTRLTCSRSGKIALGPLSLPHPLPIRAVVDVRNEANDERISQTKPIRADLRSALTTIRGNLGGRPLSGYADKRSWRDSLTGVTPTMSLTASTMLPLGSKAPDFQLPDTDGKSISLNDFRGAPVLLVAFICNHCPYVKHIREPFAALAKEYQGRGVAVVAISSNDVASYPADSPANMAREKVEAGYTFPYLYDETQDIARAFEAACTPDFYVFDADFSLVYRGQMDGSRPGNGLAVTGADLRAALDAVLSRAPVAADQKPSIGCNIKWKPSRG